MQNLAIGTLIINCNLRSICNIAIDCPVLLYKPGVAELLITREGDPLQAITNNSGQVIAHETSESIVPARKDREIHERRCDPNCEQRRTRQNQLRCA